ncbi:alkyl hydroperoxide reductase [Bosea sp. Leaf344]|uniref:peroxiredoxin-like family protein n=1 Tax=Bosea sp. Leaf344 TaxID=1736346 RepID=UPI0007017500|nr:peroxiredoxin-like family protein [Bosea sp. Leaf344]KQU49923.1 alkyl hydroperoxide reductase [Bosea sp. Leaf344]
MTDLTPLFPRQPVPPLVVPLAGGGSFDLAAESPEQFTLVVFYRGLHCPLCKAQLRDLEAKLPEFERRGVGVVAVSTDVQERAEQTKSDWTLQNLRIGFGLGLLQARAWGLYVSSSNGKTSAGLEEPPRFAEPALYLVRPDVTLYFCSVQTMPFARPQFSDVLSAIDFVVASGYPARGEVMAAV